MTLLCSLLFQHDSLISFQFETIYLYAPIPATKKAAIIKYYSLSCERLVTHPRKAAMRLRLKL